MTSVVCKRCGTLQECTGDQIPRGWLQLQDRFLCPRCSADANADEATNDILEEEVIYPTDDMIDEDECSVCDGPCQGH